MKGLLLDKVIWLNSTILAAVSFVELEAILKLILLIFSIAYTIIKMLKNSEGNPSINSWITNFFDTYFKRGKKSDDK